ncbi:hypothetical protein EDB89DRAFT_410143 [Lactarius sanguifluus]|nr:hypothetical protein EDB89DRAFT_410143 [Lactarius sanguifluus]
MQRGCAHQVLCRTSSCMRWPLHSGHASWELIQIGDYEEGTALLERILDPNQSGGCPDSVRDLASYLAGTFAYTRSTFFENPEYSEVTISRYRTLRNSSSIDGRVRRQITGILAMQTRERFIHYSLAESLEEAHARRRPDVLYLLFISVWKRYREIGRV